MRKSSRSNPGGAALGGVTSSKANSHGGGVSAHPGATDRMVGNKKSSETGPSHPAYLPGKRGRRR